MVFSSERVISLSVEPLRLDEDGRDGLLLLVAAAVFSEISAIVKICSWSQRKSESARMTFDQSRGKLGVDG